MKLTEQHIFKGYWWLPENPDNKVAGVLTYTPGENIVLELIGAFEKEDGSFKNVLDSGDRKVPLIYGIDSDSKEISLISCHSRFSLNFSCPFPMVRYTAQVMVYDKHIKDLDEKCQYTAHVRFPELSYWAPPCAIGQEMEYREKDKEWGDCTFRLPKLDTEKETICSIVCENGIGISIKRNNNYRADDLMLKPDVEQYSYIEIKKSCDDTGLSINEIFHEIHKVGQFLSLATKRNVRPESIYLIDPDVRQDYGEGKSYFFPIYILRSQGIVPNPSRLSRNNFLFRYEDLSDRLPSILAKWMSDTDNLQPIKNHLVDSLVYKPIVGSVDFLQVIQAIEGVWWRFKDDAYRAAKGISKRKQTTLNTILKELLGSLSDIPSIVKLNLDIEAVVDSRNYYSHFVDKSKKPKSLDGLALYEQTKMLRKILLCLVLELLGLSHDEIEYILAG